MPVVALEACSKASLIQKLKDGAHLTDKEVSLLIGQAEKSLFEVSAECDLNQKRELHTAHRQLILARKRLEPEYHDASSARVMLLRAVETIEKVRSGISEGYSDRASRRTAFTIREKNMLSNFSGHNIFDIYFTSSEYRKLVESGRYALVDGRLIFLSPEAVSVRTGSISLNPLPPSILARYTAICEELIMEWNPPWKNSVDNAAPRLRKDYKTKKAPEDSETSSLLTLGVFEKMIGGKKLPPHNFKEAFVFYMKEANVTVEELAERTGVSDGTIKRMRNDDDYQPRLRTIIAVCVGMHLGVFDAQYLISLAGYRLTNKKKHRCYLFLINCAYRENVSNCNLFLIKNDIKPLTALQRGYFYTQEEIQREEAMIAAHKRA